MEMCFSSSVQLIFMVTSPLYWPCNITQKMTVTLWNPSTGSYGKDSFKKRKLCIFTTGVAGGSFKNFACSNLSKSAIKFFCKGGRGTPWPIYFENLDDYQLNIDFFQSFFLGFQGRIFPILHIMVFWSWSKKNKNWGFTTFRGGVRTKVVKIHNFFFFEW